MFFLFVLSLLVGHSLASSNSTALVGWQLDDNSRSTWDIVWSCLSTIFACTWTVLHMTVPPRNISDRRWIIAKIFIWLVTIVTPEFIFWMAASGLYRTILVRKACNVFQHTRDNDSSEPKLWLSKRATPLSQAQDQAHIDLHPVHSEWTIRQCFCICAGGVALQTQDEWIYTIRPKDMKSFIQAGIIRCSDFRDRDVEDRAKSDSFAKAFTVLQSTWFLCNCIGRWAYDFPVSPIEVATVAYVCCGVLTYAVWWYRPKNMTTPIYISLSFDRKDLPTGVCNLTEGNPKGWVHLRARVKEESTLYALKTFLRPLYNAIRPASSGESDERDEPHNDETNNDLAPFEGPLDGIIFSMVCTSAALIYCAIHLAAWDFEFPTKVEQIVWRVLSLVSVGAVFIFSAVDSLVEYTSFLKSKNMLPSFMADYDQRGGHWVAMRHNIELLCVLVYIPARLGMMGLVFSSLRALPAATYTTVDWLTTIPHF